MQGISSGDYALEKLAEIHFASSLCNTLKTTTHDCTPLWTMIHNLQDFAFAVYERVLMQGLSVIGLTTSNTQHISLWDTLKCLLQIPLSREGTDQQEAGL